MVRRNRSTPSPAAIDRDWPFQVVMPDDLCTGHSFTLITQFCQERGLRPTKRQVQAIWPDGRYENWRLYCFTDRASALVSATISAASCSTRSATGKTAGFRGVWRRKGEYVRILELGPLSVPEILRN